VPDETPKEKKERERIEKILKKERKGLDKIRAKIKRKKEEGK
jgi:hypothetical protein